MNAIVIEMKHHSMAATGISVLVIGGGTMGSGIAAAFALAGHPVAISDRTAELAAAAVENARLRVEKVAARRGESVAPAIKVGDLEAGAAQAGVIVEAVPEEFSLKADVLSRAGRAAGADTLLATNTSSLSVSDLARVSETRSRLVGMHFFQPAERSRLIEVVRTGGADPTAVEAATALVKSLGRTPIVINDGPGFLVNRLARPLYLESARMVEEGFGIDAVDAIMRGIGLPIGPLEIIDRVGLEVHDAVGRSVYDEMLVPRLRPAAIIRRLLRGGRGGFKDGWGFHRYEDGRRVDPDAGMEASVCVVADGSVEIEDLAELWRADVLDSQVVHRPFGGKAVEVVPPRDGGVAATPSEVEIREDGSVAALVPRRPGLVAKRMIGCFVNEAFFVLGERYASEADIERAVTLGLRHGCGPFEWMDRFGGAAKVVETLAALNAIRDYEVAPILRERALLEASPRPYGRLT